MDFGFGEDQLALQALAKKIFGELATHEALSRLEAQGEHFHRGVWDALARAQLLGSALPEAVGGAGLGMVELCLLLEQMGETACPLPLLSTLAMASLPIARFGSDAQLKTWLEPVCHGQSVLTAALTASAEPVSARATGNSWVLRGTSQCIPALELASRVLVPARTSPSAFGVFVLDPRAAGATITTQVSTSGERLGQLELRDARVSAGDVLGDPECGAEIVAWTLARTLVGQCAFALGLAHRALTLTAEYASERRQFGRPIATFQAVSQRAADAYIDVETMRLTLWRAAWLLDQGQPAQREIAVAKAVAAEAGHRVVCAAQHIHGGMGFDCDYPLHRYFLLSKHNEFTLGSAAHHFARLGQMIAAQAT